MKLKVVSVFRTSGKAEKTGSSYDMCRVLALTSFRAFEKGESGKVGYYKREGYGSETMEPSVDPHFYPTLLKYFTANYAGEPLVIDFSTSVAPRGRGVETIIDGFASSFDLGTGLETKPETKADVKTPFFGAKTGTAG